jgi:DNA-binding CsgD family transcriptional regulator
MKIPALIQPNSGTEVFAFNDTALGVNNGIIRDVRDCPEIMDAFQDELLENKAAYKRIILRTSDPVKQVVEYIRCTRGDFDSRADISADGIVLNAFEYWDCGKHGNCPDEGIVCKVPECKNKSLTLREIEVTKLIAQDLADKQIADRLSISPNTVAIHRTNIEHKLGVASKVGIAVWAVKHNII